MKDAQDDSGEVLIADLGVRGVWLPQSEVLYDIRIVDTDAHAVLPESARDLSTTHRRE